MIKCDICSEPVYTPCRLNLHRQEMHNKNPVARDSRRHNNSEGIVESPREKQESDPEKITKTSTSVKNQVSPKKFSCGVCFAFFSRRSDLDLHELKENHRRWKCPICAKLFTWQGDLKRHIQSVHLDARPFKCTFKGCSKSYKLLQLLKKHMDMHDPDSYYIKCDVCSKKFGTRKTMKPHLLTQTDERPFPCKFFDLKYKSVSTANGHMKKCESRTADQRKKFSKWSSTIVRSAKTRKPGKIFISGKWTKLTDQAVKLDVTAEATLVFTNELNCDSTSENGTEISSSLKLIKREADFKLTKQDVDLNYFYLFTLFITLFLVIIHQILIIYLNQRSQTRNHS